MKLIENVLNNQIMAAGELGGDKIEKEGWPLFGEKFKNYENFWSNFVVPRTNRPANIHYKNSTEKIEREICSMHYAIFSDFYFIYNALRNGIEEGKDEDIFDFAIIKLANACDLMEEFLYKLLNLKDKIDVERDLIVCLVSEIKDEKWDQFFNKKLIVSLLKDRNSSGFIIASRLSVLEKHFDLKMYNQISGDIRRYRNIIAHSWQSFHLDGKVPKLAFVKKHQDWIEVTDIIKSNDTNKKEEIKQEFEPMKILLRKFTDDLIKVINSVWEQFIESKKVVVSPVHRDLSDKELTIVVTTTDQSGRSNSNYGVSGREN